MLPDYLITEFNPLFDTYEARYRIEVVVTTKERYTNLCMLLSSLLAQNYGNWDLTVVDDTEGARPISEAFPTCNILDQLNHQGHNWRVIWGPKRGPHAAFYAGFVNRRHELVANIDDDFVLFPNYLQWMVVPFVQCEQILGPGKMLGGVGGVYLLPRMTIESQTAPNNWASVNLFQGKIRPLTPLLHQILSPDVNLKEAEHINSCFLVSGSAVDASGGICLDYSPAGHRWETDLTYHMFKKGYTLLVQPRAIAWHYASLEGGIRVTKGVPNPESYWIADQQLFDRRMAELDGTNPPAL